MMFIFIDKYDVSRITIKITKFENGEFPVIDNLSIVESKPGIGFKGRCYSYRGISIFN